MSILEGIYDDAPEALGQMFIQAVKARDKDLMNNLLRRQFLWGAWYAQLTDEEKRWSSDNTDTTVDS